MTDKYEPLEPGRLQFLEARAKESISQSSFGQELHDHLLKIGGLFVVWYGPEPFSEVIFLFGSVFDSTKALMKKGERNQCHQNTARLFQNNEARVATGYGLSNDGLWRRHSWGVDSQNKIIETTEMRELYFGAILPEDVAREFADRLVPKMDEP